MSKSRIENLKQSLILVFWKNKLNLFKNWTILAQRYDTRQAYPYGQTALYQNDVQFGDKRIPLRW